MNNQEHVHDHFQYLSEMGGETRQHIVKRKKTVLPKFFFSRNESN